MKVLILAGGLGTRLHSLIPDLPKSMAKIKGKPFLEYQIEWLGAQGFEELILCIGHLAYQILDYFGNGNRWGVQIVYAVETELLGTAGAIKNAQDFIEDAFLVLNGDSYSQIDFRALASFHQHRRVTDPKTIGTIATVALDNAASYGMLKIASDGRILGFREKASAGAGWINCGIYILEPEILGFIPEGKPVSIEEEIFPWVIAEGWHLHSYPVDDFFMDIGTPEGYQRFQQYIEERGT